MPGSPNARRIWIVGLLCAAWHAPAAAQSCTVASSRVSLATFSGLRIDSLRIDAEPLREPRLLGRALARTLPRLHTRTRLATIRRELLLAAGDTVDTLRVAESLRRLRALGYLDEVMIEGRRCGSDRGVMLTVRTRDRWSEGAALRLRARSTGVLLREENLGGTGRAVRVGLQVDRTGVSATAALREPSLLGGRLIGQLGIARYGNGSEWSASLSTRRRDLDETWLADLEGSTGEREPRSRTGSIFQRTAASLALGRRVTRRGAPTMLAVLAGAEMDRADLSAARSDALVGPSSVSRSYAGLTTGLVMRAARFDTVAWLVPGDALVDLPRGFESELLVGVGRDARAGRTATHVDAWVGRIWRPSRDALVSTDAWGSGYAGGDLLRASTVRVAATALHRASRGLWVARLGGERLVEPDPDVRALSTADPTAPLVPAASRLAESAIAASLERDVHLRAITSSLGLDAAMFAASSYRWDPAVAESATLGAPESIRITTLGVGLRIAPRRHAGATIRLDLGIPVAASAGIARRPFLLLGVTPWLFGDRHRDRIVVP